MLNGEHHSMGGNLAVLSTKRPGEKSLGFFYWPIANELDLQHSILFFNWPVDNENFLYYHLIIYKI